MRFKHSVVANHQAVERSRFLTETYPAFLAGLGFKRQTIETLAVIAKREFIVFAPRPQ